MLWIKCQTLPHHTSLLTLPVASSLAAITPRSPPLPSPHYHLPTIMSSPLKKNRKTNHEPSYLRDERLARDGARHPNNARQQNTTTQASLAPQVANNISLIPPSGGTISRYSTFLAHRAVATNHGISSHESSAAASSPDVDGLDLDNHGLLTHAELSSLYGAENAGLFNHLGADEDDEDDCILDPVSDA